MNLLQGIGAPNLLFKKNCAPVLAHLGNVSLIVWVSYYNLSMLRNVFGKFHNFHLFCVRPLTKITPNQKTSTFYEAAIIPDFWLVTFLPLCTLVVWMFLDLNRRG